jgi:hypothetical protein
MDTHPEDGTGTDDGTGAGPISRALLAGPRGRRLLLQLAALLDEEVSGALMLLGHELDPGRGTARLMLTLGDREAPRVSPGDLVDLLERISRSPLDEELLPAALQESVDSARYWQEPDGVDALAALPALRESLRPLARAVAATATAGGWGRPAAPLQHVLEEAGPGAPQLSGPHGDVARWGRLTREDEARAAVERPSDPREPWSGQWWSMPLGLHVSHDHVPAALDLIEDGTGADEFVTTPVSGPGRCLEITGAEDWVRLCRELPLEVTASRRHDWFRTTGVDGRWVVPDWERVAERWDAVHLTVLGYLSGATRALGVAPGVGSVIAGWDPGATVRLAPGAPDAAGPPQRWRREQEHGAGWVPVAGPSTAGTA